MTTASSAVPAPTVSEALEHLRAGRNKQAETTCLAVLAADPGDVDAMHLLGAALANGGRPAFAVPVLEQAVAADPDPRIKVTLGTALREIPDAAASEAVLRAAIDADPSNSKAVLQLGVTLLDRRQTGAAVERLREAVSMREGKADALFWLANALLDVPDRHGAEQAFARAVELDEACEQRHLRRGRYLVNARLVDGARRHYEWGLAFHPNDPELLHELAALRGEAPVRASDEYVARHFDSFAERFDQTLLEELDYRTPDHIADALRAALPAGTHGLAVMDAGCGTGLCGPLLRPLAGRLVGVDLSRRMLEHADLRAVYDELHVAEIGAALAAEPDSYDLVVAADVLVYFGELAELLTTIEAALRPGGLAALSVETHDGSTYALNPSGRYAHAPAYLLRAARQAGLELVDERRVTLRTELGRPVDGQIAIFRRMR